MVEHTFFGGFSLFRVHLSLRPTGSTASIRLSQYLPSGYSNGCNKMRFSCFSIQNLWNLWSRVTVAVVKQAHAVGRSANPPRGTQLRP